MRAVKFIFSLLFVGAVMQGAAYGQSDEQAGGDAQPTGVCDQALSTAQRDYTERAYRSAISVLSNCMLQGDYDTATATQAYRLLSLSYLKLDELSSARGAIVQLLSKNPAYEPDPVNDVPAYRALVDLVRGQLGLASPSEYQTPDVEEPAEEETVAELSDDSALAPAGTLPLIGNVLVSAAVGLGSYGGERGVDAESWLGEFSRNAGPLLGVRAEYSFSPIVLAGLRYSVAEYPKIVTNKGFQESPEQIDPDGSSKWVHTLAATVRGRVRGYDWLYPYAIAGAATSYHYVNNSFSAGIGPLIAIGADFYVDPTMALFIEGEAIWIFPGGALDLADHYGNFDPLTSFSAGVRFRVANLRR